MILNYVLKQIMVSFKYKHQYSKFWLKMIWRCMTSMKLCIDALCTAFEIVSSQILKFLKQAMRSNLVHILKMIYKQSKYNYLSLFRKSRYYKIEFDFTPVKDKKWPIHKINKQHVWEIDADESFAFKLVDIIFIHSKLGFEITKFNKIL